MIDCATARPEESAQRVDWEGKVALIQCAQARLAATMLIRPRLRREAALGTPLACGAVVLWQTRAASGLSVPAGQKGCCFVSALVQLLHARQVAGILLSVLLRRAAASQVASLEMPA